MPILCLEPSDTTKLEVARIAFDYAAILDRSGPQVGIRCSIYQYLFRLRQLSRFDKVVAEVELFDRRGIVDEELLNQAGLALLEQGQAEQALEPFRRALELQPTARHLRSNLAAALLDAGRGREALPLVLKLVEHASEAPIVYVEAFVKLLVANGHTAQAVILLAPHLDEVPTRALQRLQEVLKK